jgi:hypothetical protein
MARCYVWENSKTQPTTMPEVRTDMEPTSLQVGLHSHKIQAARSKKNPKHIDTQNNQPVAAQQTMVVKHTTGLCVMLSIGLA